MTDVLDGFIHDSFADSESAPAFVEKTPVADSIRDTVATVTGGEKVPCPECGEMFSSRGMSRHVNRSHGTGETTPKKPSIGAKTSERRIKADEILTLAVGGIGSILAVTGVSPPTGMALKLEAGLLGPELDNLAAGTIVDKVALQPIVKTKGKFEKVGPLVLFPALVFALDKQPALLPQLYPLLRMTMMEMLPSLIAAKKKQLADAEKLRSAAKELADLDPEFAEMFGTEGADPIDALIQGLFAMKVPDEPVPTEEPGSAWQG